MKRKIIFSGCSFTWGQSLWMYEKEPKNIPCAIEWTRMEYDISKDLINKKDKYRFANIVCDELEKYEPIVKLANGGTDEESIYFIDSILDKNIKPEYFLYKDNFEEEIIDAIVLQTTQTYRSSYPFKYKGKDYKIYSTPSMKNLSRVSEIRYNTDLTIGDNTIYSTHDIENGIDLFIEYLISKNIKVEDFENEHKKLLADSIENLLKKWYDRGKKVFLLCWTDEYLEEINKRPFLKSIFVPLQYDNRTFTHIHELFYYNEEMKIDKHIKNRDMGSDEHPSSICHEVIADSIIKKWENKLI